MKYAIEALKDLRAGLAPHPLEMEMDRPFVDPNRNTKMGDIDAALKLLEPEEPEPDNWIDRLSPIKLALLFIPAWPLLIVFLVIMTAFMAICWPLAPIIAYRGRKAELAGGGA